MFVDVGQYGGEQLRAGRFEVPEGAGDEIGCAVRVFGEYRDHVDVGEESQALLGSKPGQHALGGQGVAVAAPKPVDSSCGGPDRDAGMWCVVEHLVDSVGVEGCRVADPYPAGGRAGMVSAWWLFEALRHPVRSRLADLLTLAGVAAMAGLVMLPQFLSVRQQEDIIAGHAFPTYLSKKRGLFDAVFQHSRHLNDFPVQYALIVLAAIGGLILLVKKIWWPLAVWLLLIVMNVDAGTPLGGPIGGVAGALGEFFYHDPRRIAAATTLLLMLMAGVALFATVMLLVAAAKRLTDRFRPQPVSVWASATATLLIGATLVSAWHYFPRHRFLFGDKYDSVMIDQKDLDAMAYLASLPGARDTLIGNANTDGTAWMYAVAGLHPLWTHYDYPLQQGPGYHRFIFWAYGRNGESDPRVLEAIQVLRIRYILTSTPTVRGFAVPDGLVSLETSRSWAKIYDNGEARIYEWRGTAAATHS